jgi:hypothetical protein
MPWDYELVLLPAGRWLDAPVPEAELYAGSILIGCGKAKT